MKERAMREPIVHAANPELRQLVSEASRSLACLDAARLEELALSCEALSQGYALMSAEERREVARQASESRADMAVFARVLEATRSNLKVVQRLRELHGERVEYRDGLTAAYWSEAGERNAHGDN